MDRNTHKQWALNTIATIRHELQSIENIIKMDGDHNALELSLQVCRLQQELRRMREG